MALGLLYNAILIVGLVSRVDAGRLLWCHRSPEDPRSSVERHRRSVAVERGDQTNNHNAVAASRVGRVWTSQIRSDNIQLSAFIRQPHRCVMLFSLRTVLPYIICTHYIDAQLNQSYNFCLGSKNIDRGPSLHRNLESRCYSISHSSAFLTDTNLVGTFILKLLLCVNILL